MRQFELGRPSGSRRYSWLTSVALHGAAFALAVAVAWRPAFRPRPTAAPEVREWVVLPPVPQTRPVRRAAAPPPGATQVRLAQPVPIPRQPMPEPEPMNVPLRAPPATMKHERGPIVQGPQLADGRPWVSPRPALPAVVAEALYGEKDTVLLEEQVQRRLRAMLDTLNRAIDVEQRSGRRPTWATEIAGLPFSMDSQYINIAGIKVPTVALALLGNFLPTGNYDGALEARAYEDMRQDMLQAAARTQNYRDFRKYVKEIRERKQAERDSARVRPTPPAPPPPLPSTDTTRVIP